MKELAQKMCGHLYAKDCPILNDVFISHQGSGFDGISGCYSLPCTTEMGTKDDNWRNGTDVSNEYALCARTDRKLSTVTLIKIMFASLLERN